MSSKAIRECDGKFIIAHYLHRSHLQLSNDYKVTYEQDMERTSFEFMTGNMCQYTENQCYPQLVNTGIKYVVKPDMLIKRRGKLGLLGLNMSLSDCLEWIKQHPTATVEDKSGPLTHFIIEPFIPHTLEYYICITSTREGDCIYFHHEGGIDIGDVDSKAIQVVVPVLSTLTPELVNSLLAKIPIAHQQVLSEFIHRLYAVYCDLHFTYLEINPLVVLEPTTSSTKFKISMMDLAAKIDQTADFECGDKYQQALHCKFPQLNKNSLSLDFPAPFGRSLSPAELFIQQLDAKTGASLKLTILNPNGRIWTLVAGGGASVAYADAITNAGYAKELANYGEYSGAPSTEQTYLYTKTLLEQMIASTATDKVLLIGGGIANFTNVASTFKGIIKALKEFSPLLQKTSIFVRRAGPNYQQGLQDIKQCTTSLKLNCKVYGPETHLTSIVLMALKNVQAVEWQPTTSTTTTGRPAPIISQIDEQSSLFTSKTTCFIIGMQPKAVQGMLDFDFICKRQPSVNAIIYPFGGDQHLKFYFGTNTILLPVYDSLHKALQAFPTTSVIVNFTSCRSVYASTVECFNYKQIKTIALIAEGVPERKTRHLCHLAKQHDVLIVGPATVGGLKPGCFKIGNTGGMMDNIIHSRLYRPGNVGYVSKSGGMSNELNHLISRCTNGVYEGIAIGGDTYPCSTFIDHIHRLDNDPNCKLIVILGENGGLEEYKISKSIKTPLVAWCLGTCASLFTSVQFGHAGSMAKSDKETATAKNQYLKDIGVHVPSSFEELPEMLTEAFNKLDIQDGVEPEVPQIPMDYQWAVQLGLVRKPANFISTITDDRGEELLYAGVPISHVFEQELGIGGVVSLLWFKRKLPPYACKFIEMVLILTADHGPAVSGAHNTIVTSRAGKDLISSIVSGMLTIGDKFGGALDGAAMGFSQAYDENKTPREYVESMRAQNKLILGIGHLIKSKTNPDMRVELVKKYAKSHFPRTPMLDYALQVEEITVQKKENLILNVDGAIGVLFVDLLRYSGAFNKEEAEEYIKIGALNGLFVLGRTIGFTGHYLDQKRLKQGLYRHPVLVINVVG